MYDDARHVQVKIDVVVEYVIYESYNVYMSMASCMLDNKPPCVFNCIKVCVHGVLSMLVTRISLLLLG
jgi:hypothetical protein